MEFAVGNEELSPTFSIRSLKVGEDWWMKIPCLLFVDRSMGAHISLSKSFKLGAALSLIF